MVDQWKLQASRWDVESKGFLDFVHRPEFWIIRKHISRKLDLSPSSADGKETHTLLGPLEKADLTSFDLVQCHPDSAEDKQIQFPKHCFLVI
jgi:hypothetical protein